MAEVGQIIGRVSIKVFPDTSSFRGQLRRDLEKIERSLKVEIPTSANMAGAKRDVLRGIREINAQVKNNPIRANVEVVVELVQSSLDRVRRDLERWAKDISPLKIYVVPELLAGASAYVAARLSWLTRPRNVSIIPTLNSAALTKVATALAALSGARMLNDIFDRMWRSLKNLDKAIPSIVGVSLAIVGLTGYVGASLSNLFSLSSSLASIAATGLTLPGIFGGFVAGVGISIAALKDFNDVLPEVQEKLSALQDSLSAKFWNQAEAPIRNFIDSIWPEFSAGVNTAATALGNFFGSFATSLGGALDGALAGMFADLAESVNIAASATDVFAGIIATLGTVGAGYLPRLAQWFVDISTTFDNWLSGAAADGRLTTWINEGIEALMDLGRVIGNASSILAGLARAASAAGGATLDTLADSLGRVAEIVNGPTFQTNLTGVLQAAHAAMQNIATTSGPAVTNLFETLATTLQQVLPVVGETIGLLVEGIANALSQPAVVNGIITLFGGLREGVKGLLPALAPMGAALGALFTLIGTMAAEFGPVLGAALGVLAPVFQQIATALVPVVQTLGPVLQTVIATLAPIVQALGDTFVRVSTALMPLITAVGQLVAFLGPILVPVITFIITLFGSMLVGAINGVTLVIQGVIAFFQNFIAFFQNAFTWQWGAAWQNIKNMVIAIWNIIKGAFLVWLNVGILGVLRKGLSLLFTAWKVVWTNIKVAVAIVWATIRNLVGAAVGAVRSRVQAVIGALRGWLTAAWGFIRNAAVNAWNALRNAVVNTITNARASVSNVVNNIKTFLSNAWASAVSTTKAKWQNLKDAIVDKGQAALAWVKDLPGKIKNGLGDMGGALLDAGKAAINGLWDGMKAKWEELKKWLSGKLDEIKKLKGPIQEDRKALIPEGQAVMEGFLQGLEQGWRRVQDAIEDMTADLVGGELVPDIQAYVDGNVDENGPLVHVEKHMHYQAAEGSSLGAEEDLFAAMTRGRALAW
jgi:phage-related protein